ncbi:MAG: hypothetical protein ACREO3_03060, partial [Arenimonas sp.]
MDFEDDDDGDALQSLRNSVLAGMREYLAMQLDGGGDAGYTGADIGDCGRILDSYLTRVAAATEGDEEAVRGAVQEAVQALNELNTRCNDCLIETDQREH